ncbi:MAG: alpha/beta hydrolase [Alphaproteobacteria bacterium]|nr:alpha/beta hydrolase [Alphaproteobacteria bacterium]MBU0797566.1 alpha/beta hydrolase [Alphaproteobacteria bacterium]MBU0885630.1 alpha/beta hydrolase [Alphaproteobacteria bacterium]MBU1812714.1 alpha/beta hydrolase [Alphaproteobacteria bacterium]MBU2092201.1 alpha/beta hydrolase [Alphaproteobacteria bacterium]
MTDKIPLLLLPGLLCDEKLWAPQIEALSGIADATVADLTQHDSFPAMADAVLATAPAQFALAGLSMGGYVAQQILRQAPERVLKLALLDTSARADTEEQTTRRRGLIELAQKGRFKGVTPRLMPMLIHPQRLEDKKLTDTIIAMAEHVGMDGFLKQQKAIMGRPDGRPDLPKITVPTLVLCGRQDALTSPALHEEIHAGIPGSRLVVIEECGHLSTLERPAEVNMAMREWLRG